jgi:uncharacterized protein (DUF58 family)
VLTRSGWLVLGGAAATLVAGRLFGLVELYLVAVALAALLALAVGRVLAARLDLQVGRQLSPRRVHAGQPARVELTVGNHGRRPTPVLRVHDPVSGTQGASVLLSPIEPEVVVRSAYRLPTERRGLIGVGPLAVIVADPFNLAAVRVPAAGETELTVLPRVDEILPPALSGGDEPLSGVRTATLAASAGDDFAALRDYVVGDDLRRVHWPSSARHDDLVIRQDEVHWQGRTTVVLDTRSAAHTASTFEAAVSAAASIIAAAWKRRDLIRLLTTAGFDSGVASGNGHAERLLDELAKVHLAHPGTLRGAVGALGRGSTGAVVVVTGQVQPAEIGGLAAAGLGRNALTVVACESALAADGNGIDAVGLDGAAGFAAAWNARMVARRVRRQPRARVG